MARKKQGAPTGVVAPPVSPRLGALGNDRSVTLQLAHGRLVVLPPQNGRIRRSADRLGQQRSRPRAHQERQGSGVITGLVLPWNSRLVRRLVGRCRCVRHAGLDQGDLLELLNQRLLREICTAGRGVLLRADDQGVGRRLSHTRCGHRQRRTCRDDRGLAPHTTGCGLLYRQRDGCADQDQDCGHHRWPTSSHGSLLDRAVISAGIKLRYQHLG